ncbi:MAG TPA: biotin/lipoyl-binding protein, partial [Desulfomonilia bacterium]|nr:biotin/lipoyl-binding protein [Desulfomonilia bacterium]
MQGDSLDKLTIAKDAKKRKVFLRFKPSYVVLVAAAAAAAVVFAAWAFFSRGEEVKVAVVSGVYPSQLLANLNASGYVVAQRKADVAAKITGQLVAITVQEGSIVKEGQLIAQLENADAKALVEQSRARLSLAKARLEQAQADLGNASLDFDRKKNLVASGAVSMAEYDAAETRYLSVRAGLDASRAEVASSDAVLKSALVSQSYAEIRAPFDAVVLTKNADVGDIITPFGAAASA